MSARHYIDRTLDDIDSWDARRLAPVDEARVITALARRRAEQALQHPAKCGCDTCRTVRRAARRSHARYVAHLLATTPAVRPLPDAAAAGLLGHPTT